MPRSVCVPIIALLTATACLPPPRIASEPNPTLSASDTTANTDSSLLTMMDSVSISLDGGPGPLEVSAPTLVPDPVATAAPHPVDASWDIEVEEYLSHDRVEFYLNRFTGDARDRIVSWMQRGKRYEPMIRETFREAGIPEDMYYLALVESGYDVHAYSRAAAVGMWQFIASTGKGMGLRVDWWMDERRDPVRSTEAAARFLGSLKEQFGSMYLAAAAYNGGPARVSRGLTRFADAIGDSEGDDQFFALADTRALRKETSNYVPQLIAAAAIGKEPWKYGIELDSVEPFSYDSVHVPAETAIGAVALAGGLPLDSVRDLNPQLIRGTTPPGDSVWVRVPRGSAMGFDSAFAALPDSVRRAWRTVRVKKATTLASLAKSYGMSATQLRWYNPRLKSTRVTARTSINVPTKLAIAAAFDVPDPALARGGPAPNGVHVVRKGETLSHIARWNNTTVSRLMALNGLKKSVIYPGQTIRVRAAAPTRKK